MTVTNLYAAQNYILRLEVNSTPHGVHHRFWLFKDFLLHERAVVT